MKRIILMSLLVFVFVSGCDVLRFAPSEKQKENAWLHNRTAVAAAQAAKDEVVSNKLQKLTELSKLQSKSFVSYFGLPKEPLVSNSVEEILAQSNWQLAETALSQSSQRPDAWEVTDSALELGIAVVALFGGVYGTKVIGFLKEARDKSKALKEIIDGNELFKKINQEHANAFKEAQKEQSASTRQLVVGMKS
ncbi:MAG: hypothetical protein ACYSUK_04305 [Planctomycetota bacterium]